jgi:hypothetical protein
VNDAWKMTETGPEALLEVPEWGTILVRWLSEGRCQAWADSDPDRPEAGVITRSEERWFVSQALLANDGWAQEKGGRHRAIATSGDVTGAGRKPIPATGQAKLNEAVSAAVSDFAQSHPGVLIAAQRCYLTRELSRAVETLKAARRQLALAESVAATTAKRLTQLDEREVETEAAKEDD